MIFAIDFETYYDKQVSITTQGVYHYLRDAACDIYLVAVYSEEANFSYVGTPRHMNWPMLNGHTLVAHHARFDRACFERLQELGIIPQDIVVFWECTADMASALGVGRSLKSAIEELFHVSMSKEVRNEMQGVSWQKAIHEGKAESVAAGFPWTAAFLETLFPDVIQRERFLAAWAYAYRNAYAGHPRNGHVLFIAGEPGVGKNFLTECLYGPSLGGYVDASEYLLARTRFNDGLFNVGVWTCNDSVTKGDAQERTVFARMLKKMSANVRHVWEGKYKQAASLDWSGRVCVTLNTDPMSLAILPDIDINNKDKVSLFRTSAAVMNEPQAVVFARQEMGALCSFLLHWKFPQHCIGDARWGVRNFLHPELLAEATNSGSTAAFRDILALFAQSMFEADGRLALLEGSATWFLQQMLEQDSLKEMLRGTVSATSIGKRMSALANSGVFPLTYVRSCTQRIWRIERASFEVYLKQGMEEEVSDEICPF